jgi:coenzyme Q-binding protein COQ10
VNVSRVGFFIDYEFKSRTLGALMGSLFDAAFRKFARAFEERADAVYGQGQCKRPDFL